MSRLPIVLIAAVARNGVIGGNNQLLWRLSSDLKRFKALTWGKPVIMGRKTFESIGKPLPGREIIVVTRDRSFHAAGVRIAHSLEEAIELAELSAPSLDAYEIIVAGGGEIYAQAISMADRLEITHVDCAPEGDSFFPTIDPARWTVVSRIENEAGPDVETGFAFSVYEPRRKDADGVENQPERA